MKILNYFGKEQKIYYEKLDNGLEVYVAPNKKRAAFHVEFVTKYGSDIDEFIPLNESKYIQIPAGAAHFLEHKMFDMPNENIFESFCKAGIYSNAGTNYLRTKYYIEGVKKFKENLDNLITMVMTPYFTDEGIEKEFGIIDEEIKMYDDEINYVLDFEARKMVHQQLFQRNIAGTCESIREINADLLKKIHATFYQPSNMFLVVAGNISPKDVLSVVKNNEALNKAISNQPVIYKEKKETKEVGCEYQKIVGNAIYPKLKYSHKFDLNEFSIKDRDVLVLYLNMIFSHLFDDGSAFEEYVRSNKIATVFYLEHSFYHNAYVLSLDSESMYADLFKDEVDKTLQNIQITEEDFERIKKVWISIGIRGIDNVALVANSICSALLKEEDIDYYNVIKKMKYEELLEVIQELDFSNKSFILIVPKDNAQNA